MGLIWGVSLMLMAYGTPCSLVVSVISPAGDLVELGPCALPQNTVVKGNHIGMDFKITVNDSRELETVVGCSGTATASPGDTSAAMVVSATVVTFSR